MGEIHLHFWSFIFVRHGGHVHRDFFCFLFTRFAVSLSSSSASLDPLSWVLQVLIVRASIALGPSEGASLMHTHSSRSFFKVSPIGIYNECFEPPRVPPLSSCSASQSRALPFLPPRRTFLVATTIACCPCLSSTCDPRILLLAVRRSLPGDS